MMDKAKVPVPIGKEAEEEDTDEVFDLEEGRLPLAFTEKRHTEKIEGTTTVTQTWRMKERMKTVSVALVMCLNVGVDPPDVVKTSPCARMECWIDPLAMGPQKSLEAIGASLQRQYERWQPRARYKQSLDPTSEEVKKLCTSLRRNAKEERVLFHYNGHGVPRPTVNGELWVFNKSYTQYIPLSVYDLQMWMGSPSIYVYDCSNAGIILESFKTFSQQREQEIETAMNGQRYPPPAAPSNSPVKNCIQLAACGPKELLPMNPDLPADLFTACLTTPIKIALKWFVLQNTTCLVPGMNMELIEKIPGQLNDRRTMLGELNWIFTAITDTVAWNTLPRDLFQKLFRQDLLVASLFRNFLLAERIMRSYNCTPVSSPKLPATYQHPMWQAWDLALDLCLTQLPGILNEGKSFQHSLFFAEQLTAFQVWLAYGSNKRNPPEQLPIVLQVLLSQVHRLRALDLLGRFLDLGPWAVSLALSVGIFPYVLKLLQSSARELRPLLVFIWAKILAVDSSCQADLVKDNGHKYFLSVLSDPYMPAEHRTMAAFVLAMIVNDYPNGQEAALQGNLIAICLEQLNDSSAQLRQWLALCLGKVWTNFDAARWCGVRDSAHEKLYKLLSDPVPEVRAAAVYALGTFINNSTERSDHANNIDHGVGMTVSSVLSDGSPLVRKELVVALGGLVAQFETQFATLAFKLLEEEKLLMGPQGEQRRLAMRRGSDTAAFTTSTSSAGGMRRSASSRSLRGLLSPSTPVNPLGPLLSASQENLGTLSTAELTPVKRISSSSSLGGLAVGMNSVYSNLWKVLTQLTTDPQPKVADMARALINSVKLKVSTTAVPRHITPQVASRSAPSSPSNKPSSHISPIGETPPHNTSMPNAEVSRASPARPTDLTGRPPRAPHSAQFQMTRKLFEKGPHDGSENGADSDGQDAQSPRDNVVHTNFFAWCCRYFAQPVMCLPADRDTESESHHEQEFRMYRAAQVQQEAAEEQSRAGFSRLDDQIFINRNQNIPTVLRFHPYESHLAVADKDGISIWDWDQGVKLNHFCNFNPKRTRMTAMEFINPHDRALLLTGTDDGAVRLWRNYYSEEGSSPRLVSAFMALSDMLASNRGSGLVIDWEQRSGMLMASGDVRSVRVWDTEREMKVQDLPTGADSCVTSLAADGTGQSLLVAGCGDGSVRLYDRRLPGHECRVMTLWEHKAWVVNVHLQKGAEGKIISGSVGGDIRFWDPRFTESVRTISTTQGLTALEVHKFADVLACGSANQLITMFNQSGDTLSTIKYHEGFMGQRIGPVTAMAFHPYRVKLAAASTDAFVSVYSNPDYRRR